MKDVHVFGSRTKHVRNVGRLSPFKTLPPIDACTYFGEGGEQAQFDMAVVIPTLGRPVLGEALDCIFKQDMDGRIQVLVGFDVGGAIPDFLYTVLERRPSNVSVLMLHLPFSTAVRHGGPHLANDGGALRTILSYMANSRYIAYLDDDNRWAPSHLRLMRQAIAGRAYAFAPRMLIDGDTGQRIGQDIWDSVGPGKGRMAAEGGFVDPSCLVVDKIAVAAFLGRWAEVITVSRSVCSDRWFFAGINQMPFGSINEPTVEYSPEVITTDGLRSYKAAMKEIGNAEKQEVGRWANNRVENSHQPFRRRERAMLRFRQMKSLQKFASVHASFHNHFNKDRHLTKRDSFKDQRSAALAEWKSLMA